MSEQILSATAGKYEEKDNNENTLILSSESCSSENEVNMYEIIDIYGGAPNPHLRQSGWGTEKMPIKGSKYPELNDRDWLYKKYWVEELTHDDISDIVGCSRGSVYYAFLRLNIKNRNIKASAAIRKKRYPLLYDCNWLYEKYRGEDLNPSKIALLIGCTENPAREAIIRCGIPRRSPSEARSGKKNPMYGIRLNGEKSSNWKGGISFEPYCPKFNDVLKEEIRDKFGRKCFICPITEEENGEKLCIHHVDYNKQQGCNGILWLLVPLCRPCNVKVNNNREYWQNFITEKMLKEGYL